MRAWDDVETPAEYRRRLARVASLLNTWPADASELTETVVTKRQRDERLEQWRPAASGKGLEVRGEVTLDGGIHRRVTPQIITKVAETKARLGICQHPGCKKIAGHKDEHTDA